MFLTGLAIFTVASALCGLADSQALLVGARFVQGAGGAMTSSVILGMIVTMFPEPREQAKAMGVFSFVAAGGASIGLLAGGVLTQALDWHWIFFVNLPIGVLATLAAVRVVTADQGIGIRAGADLPGATLVTGALMLAVYTIVKTSDYGWGSAHTLILGAVAVAVLAAFLAREATAGTPLIPLRIFRSRNVSGANLVQMLMIAGIFGMFFLGAVYMQRVLGYDPLQVGLAYLPVAISIGTMSLFVAPQLNMKIGPRATLLPGLVLMTIGLLLFAAAPVHADYVTRLLPVMLLLGVGAGLSFPSLMTIAMSGAEPSEAGLASGLVNTSMQVGGALGLAVLATLSASRAKDVVAAGGTSAAGIASGLHLALLIGAGLVIAAIVIGVAVLAPARALGQAQTEAAERDESARISEGLYSEAA
jgi:EmrB/QacA subfamily drug resistance transporter